MVSCHSSANRLGYALYWPVFDNPARPANLARFRFLDPRSNEFYPEWDDSANTTVALLRTSRAGPRPSSEQSRRRLRAIGPKRPWPQPHLA
jgi:hypothetical protein